MRRGPLPKDNKKTLKKQLMASFLAIGPPNKGSLLSSKNRGVTTSWTEEEEDEGEAKEDEEDTDRGGIRIS